MLMPPLTLYVSGNQNKTDYIRVDAAASNDEDINLQ